MKNKINFSQIERGSNLIAKEIYRRMVFDKTKKVVLCDCGLKDKQLKEKKRDIFFCCKDIE
tara:strand:- start:353 stop:535 length:183 start_codon:yes stop_codon:yes gene_type:complete